MPKWGLTVEQRRTKPWGLLESALEPAKTITDPVHGDVFINQLEACFLNSAPLQRLRRVRQLGNSHLIYPGATHSRFSHALGTLRAAQDLLDAVVAGLSGPRPVESSLLGEWQREGATLLTNGGAGPSSFDAKLAEATVLARLGGLLHDFCHVPLGHTIEDDLGVLKPHDANTERFERLWDQLPPELREQLGDNLTRELRVLILSKEEDDRKIPEQARFESKYPFVTDIVGNTICADLIDYIQRDHLATGLPLALGNRFANDFYVTSKNEVHWPQRMVVRVSRHGHIRRDAITELVKYLRYRYELSERVLYHHAKVAADAMIGKLLEMWRDSLWVDLVNQNRPALLADPADGADVAKLRSKVEIEGDGLDKVLDGKVQDILEQEFTRWSDDGLLEHLALEAEQASAANRPGAKRQVGISRLSRMVLNRELFKTLGRAASDADLASAKSTYKLFGSPEARRRLEQTAARFAGIRPRWKLVLWVPSPKMRMKVADVLVEVDGRVAPLAEMETISSDANAIVKQHQRLWGVGAYIHPDVSSEWQKRAALARLKDEMGLGFLDARGLPVPSVVDLIETAVSEDLGLDATERTILRGLVHSSGMGGGQTFRERLHEVDRIRKAQRVRPERELSSDLFH
jgi:HD superfamily phosphohydrolase